MPNIIETATAANSFKTLITAVKAAGLVETLTGTGPFTVFAPNDEAFAKLPQGTVEELLKNIPKLKRVLSYHVVAGKMMASEVSKLPSAKTLEGQSVGIASNNGVKVNDAKLIKADITCDNGVIHVIDTVLTLPTAKSTAF
ncbi:MAG TPA: fasciclin domain-containing protein [Blastocatellia bacterium]|jgi:uncharacterized surface protein with fasciclin (FAS1) repeats